ncbi:MAG: AzlC family ABC transporter permease [Eubacteriales bacterium]
MNFKEGIKAGLPIWLGYIPIAIAYGVLGKAAGLDNSIIILMSIMVYAGASQFIGVNLLAAGIPGVEVILTTFMINIRHMIMSASLAMKIEEHMNLKKRMLVAFGITDETFSLTSVLGENKKLSFSFLIGVNFSAYLSWVVGSMIGIAFSQMIPSNLSASMGIALYAMFVALLVPSIRKSKTIFVVSVLAAVFHTVIVYGLNVSNGWTLVTASIAAALIGTFAFTEESTIEE